MEKAKKFMLIGVIAVISFSILIWVAYNPSSLSTTSPSNPTNDGSSGRTIPNPEEVLNVTVSVDFKNGTIRTWYHINLTEGHGHVYNALLNCTTDIEVDWYGTDVFVKAIQGKQGGLVYSVDGYKPNHAANKYYLNSNDKVLWEYV